MLLQPFSQCWASVFVRMRVAGMPRAQALLRTGKGLLLRGLGRGTRAAGHACLP